MKKLKDLDRELIDKTESGEVNWIVRSNGWYSNYKKLFIFYNE